MTKVFEFITELVGWVGIVLSPLLIGMIIGVIIYVNYENNIGMVIGIIISIIGLVIGIIVATRAWKNKGTVHFLSRLSATPDLDNLEDQSKIDK